MYDLRYRQIHLDFHTSPAIEGIGEVFDKDHWQAMLKMGHVDSITCFAVCHHGWSYHETTVGKMHPHLSFDLLRAQYDACKEIDVNVPIYITAGVNNRAAEEHPEWREITPEGAFGGWTHSPLAAGFKTLCFGGPYLDYLCELIRETVTLFPDCDGIFLDIISQGQCCCQNCLEGMRGAGLDPLQESDRKAYSRQIMLRYYEQTTAAVKHARDDMPVFHNSGHVTKGDKEILTYFSHLELESLPTGGWGYDHFPASAKYAHKLAHDFLGMTGKFHNTWGDFGGYKHPNALRYECAAMQAFGSKCSVGDQLHPNGQLDESTYGIIGAAYAEVEAREPWCRGAHNVADIALVALEAFQPQRDTAADVGASRLLLEGHYLFDIVDADMPLEDYRAVILPDSIPMEGAFGNKIEAFAAAGGKVILSGTSGLRKDGSFVLDTGCRSEGQSSWQPDFVRPRHDLAPAFVKSPITMVLPSQQLEVTDGEVLGDIHAPYFNRRYDHFCSHQYAPARAEPSGYACAVRKGNILTFAHPVFSIYRGSGSVAIKDYVLNTLDLFLGEDRSLTTNLPSTARVSVMDQAREGRRIVHLLHGNTVTRGGTLGVNKEGLLRDTYELQVIEELLPLMDVEVCLRVAGRIQSVSLEPQGDRLAFTQEGDRVCFGLERFECHQMVVLSYGRGAVCQ